MLSRAFGCEAATMSDDEFEWTSTPPERLDVINVNMELPPEKSKDTYMKHYRGFVDWCIGKRIERSEYWKDAAIFAWTVEQLRTLAPTTVRSRLAMIKAVILARDEEHVQVEKTEKLLDQKDRKYVKKKSAVFSKANIDEFYEKAPDQTYLAVKVAASLSIMGALRKCELHDLTLDDIQPHDNGYQIHVKAHKSDEARDFFMDKHDARFLAAYLKARPQGAPVQLMLTQQKNGNIMRGVIGINTLAKFPAKIAQYLQLTDPKSYTGHAFRRTSATFAAEAGIDMVNLKRLGGWKSDTVAQGYIAESDTGRKKRAAAVRAVGPDDAACPVPTKKTATDGVFNAPAFIFSGTVQFTNCTFTAGNQ